MFWDFPSFLPPTVSEFHNFSSTNHKVITMNSRIPSWPYVWSYFEAEKYIKELLREGKKKVGASEKESKISFFLPFSVGIFSSCTSNINGGTFTFDITNNAIFAGFFLVLKDKVKFSDLFFHFCLHIFAPKESFFAARKGFCNHKVRFKPKFLVIDAVNSQFRLFTTLYRL